MNVPLTKPYKQPHKQPLKKLAKFLPIFTYFFLYIKRLAKGHIHNFFLNVLAKKKKGLKVYLKPSSRSLAKRFSIACVIHITHNLFSNVFSTGFNFY